MTDEFRITDPVPGVWTQVADDRAIDVQRLESDSRAASDSEGVPGSQPAPFALAVKANIGVRGFVRSAGSPVLDRDAETADAPVIAAFRAAGAIVVGMANMHELAFGISSDNVAFGAVRLPGHADRSAGGSSGGSAAAVASGAVPIALGTDTGGSVSVPASLCGVVGFRPSTGRWPTAGLVGLSHTRDTAGVFTRDVATVSRADAWVTQPGASGRHVADHGRRTSERLRLGVPSALVSDLAPETAAAFDAARSRLADRVDIVEVDFDDVFQLTSRAEMPIVLYESRRLLGQIGAEKFGVSPDDAFRMVTEGVASPDVAGVLGHELGNPVTAGEYARAQHDTIEARRCAGVAFATADLDALLFPTTPVPAPLISDDNRVAEVINHLGVDVPTFNLYTRNTGQGTMLGAPMLTLPLPVATGALPIGLTLQGPRFGDEALLAMGRELEVALR